MNSKFRLHTLLTSLTLTFLIFIAFITLFITTPPSSQAQPSTFTFKNQDGIPINGEMRLLCFTNYQAPAPFADLNIVVIDGAPAPTTPLPAACTHLAALHLRHTQPAGKHNEPAYWIYSTSWQPGTTHPLTATGDITLNDSWPLTVVNLVVSLGWQPAPNSTVTTTPDVQQALYQMAQELYDWTEGQIIVGPIAIHTNGQQWAKADFRFSPANDKRPSAFVGGIVNDIIVYNSAFNDTTYTPAAIYLGRLWDGQDAFIEESGRWHQPNAYRTLAHEWAHYALFLYDEYQDNSGSTGYCICDTLNTSGCTFNDRDGSAMSYHYNATEFWHKDTHLTVSNFCYDTWQFRAHNQTDWDTLTQWPTIQELSLPITPLRFPSPELEDGPALGLAAHLFGRPSAHRLFLPLAVGGYQIENPTEEPLLNIILETAVSPTSTLPSQIYLLQGDAQDPTRILPQGRTTGALAGNTMGQIRLLGVQENDTVRAYVNRPALGTTDAIRYTVMSNEEANNDIILVEDPWDFLLEHHFEVKNSQVATLTLTLADGDGRLGNPVAQLCSLDAAIGCHFDWQHPMENRGGEWQVIFTPLPEQNELPRYLVVRIWDDDDQAVEDELVQWLQVAGGVGPTHNDAMAPLVDDVVMANTPQPIATADECNLVSYMPAANARALKSPLPPGFGGLLGTPLDIQILFNLDICPPPQLGQNILLPNDILLNLGYSQDEVTRLGLDEQTQLFVLHYRAADGWVTWQQIGVNDDLNWITTTTTEDGIYAIGWQP